MEKKNMMNLTYRKHTMRTRIAGLLLFLVPLIVNAQSPVVKMDFDQSGRQKNEVNQVGYIDWVVAGVTSASRTEEGVTFTVTKAGSFGDVLGTNWYKTGIQASDAGKLVNDGVTVKDGTANDGGQLELRISGLQTGSHTILAFLNAVDSDTYTFSPIDIFIDSILVADNVVPTVRAANSAEAQSVYLKFDATTGNDVVILFAADTSGTEDFKNVMFNGFELNTPNISLQATGPVPVHNDEHVLLNSGNIALSWTPNDSAVSQNIYFGTDPDSVVGATLTSTVFQASQDSANSSFEVMGLYSGETYYWRVDQITASGEVTKGNLWRFRPAQLAFPAAEGYGRFARGGRGGKVVVVSNLNDSGPGSLRDAITNESGPRTIVFSVSGIIDLQSRLTLNDPYVTVAGQTAPGKGITIASAPFGVTGDDCVVQNIRVRLGGGPTFDGMGLTGGDHSIIDHCSISWTIDEAFSSRGANNITLQRTLISEALNAAGHQNYPAGTEHGYAASIGGDVGSFHHNLLAHNYGRNWSLAGGLDGSGAYAGRLDITNNVVYNWGARSTDGGAAEVNFVGNYYKPGAGTTIFKALVAQNEGAGTGAQQYFFEGNVMPGYFDESNQTAGRIATGVAVNFDNFLDSAFFPSHVTTQTARHAYKIVLSDVGCTQPAFDDHDQRMISETLAGTYTVVGSVTGKKGFPDNEADAGGYEEYPIITRPSDWDTDSDGLPDWYETIIGTDINSSAGDFSDTNADDDLDGYTNLDDYLQWMDQPNFSTPNGETIAIHLLKLSRGFTNEATYTVSNVVNGTHTLTDSIVAFTPTNEGLASFDFTVTDAEGDSMTRSVNILNGYDLGTYTLSLDKSLPSQVAVWPVPNTGEFFIKMEERRSKSSYRIFDILGKEIAKGSLEFGTTQSVMLQDKGLFILQVVESDSRQIIHTQKLLVQ